MTEADATARDEMGLHVVLTAYGLSLLKGDQSEAALRDNIAVVTRWYRDRSDSLQALMHDEPLYNAMRVMGRDPRILDRDHDEVWKAYWKVYDEGSDRTLRRDGAHWNALIDHAAHAVTAGYDRARRASRPGSVTPRSPGRDR